MLFTLKCQMLLYKGDIELLKMHFNSNNMFTFTQRYFVKMLYNCYYFLKNIDMNIFRASVVLLKVDTTIFIDHIVRC